MKLQRTGPICGLFLVNNMLNFQLIQFIKSLSQTEILDSNALTVSLLLKDFLILFYSLKKANQSLTNKLSTVTQIFKEINYTQKFFPTGRNKLYIQNPFMSSAEKTVLKYIWEKTWIQTLIKANVRVIHNYRHGRYWSNFNSQVILEFKKQYLIKNNKEKGYTI